MAEDMPIAWQLAKIHNFLKAELVAFSSSELLERIGVDIDNSPEILLSLTGDASKVTREDDGKWRWASKYPIRNFNQLLTLMARSRDGITEKDLYDSYKGIKDDIKKLKKRGAFYEVKSASRILLFPRDRTLEMPISEEVKDKYMRVKLPDAIEIHRYLVRNKLKETEDETGVKIMAPVSRKRPSSRKDGKRKRARRIKLTNTHLDNSSVDLNKDYKSKKSAFN